MKEINLEEASSEMLIRGTNLHNLLFEINFKNPDFKNVNNNDAYLIRRFLNSSVLDISNTISTYREYEFYDEEVHGIIDLIVEYKDHYKIIDYKLSDINDSAYEQQLRGYKNYLSKMWSNTREWGVSLLSQMDDTQRKTQEALRKDFWAARFNAVDAHNREYNCLSQICRLVSNNA